MEEEKTTEYTLPDGAPPYQPRRDRIIIRLVHDPNAEPEQEVDPSFMENLSLSDKAKSQIRAEREAKMKAKIHEWEVVAVGEGTMTQSGLIPNVSQPGTIVILTGYPVESSRMMTELGYEGYAMVQDNQVLMEKTSSES